MIRLNGDWSEVYDELDRLEGMPDHAMRAVLDSVLLGAFFATQEDVHVITGSLRGSGNVKSEVDGDEWSGEVSYGGPSPGFPFDPVRYAAYEQRRGGDHDFMHPFLVFHDRFAEAMRDVLEG